MLNDKQITQVQEELFKDEDMYVYAVVDGAACPELRFKIYDWQPESACLWSGELEPDVEEVAPYMVMLEKNTEFTRWLIKEGFTQHWNIFVSSKLEPKAFRKQIRKLQLVRSPEGKTMVFRFYDPRIMEKLLPTCTPEQLVELFDNFTKVQFPMNRALSLSTNIFDSNEALLSSKVTPLITEQPA